MALKLKGMARQVEQAKQQNQNVEHQKRAAGPVQVRNQPGLPAQAQQYLQFGQARVAQAQVATAVEHRKQRRLTDDHQRAAHGDVGQWFIVVPGEKRQPQQQ
jgi:hypothetical protein